MRVNIERDYSISLIRLIATAFIILCHIMQYFDIELAWWFNVGVQIFLCMSGFLYGKKGKISEDLKFYRKNIIKILVDYYIVIIPVIILLAVFYPEQLSIKAIIKALFTYETLSGGGHLWYIPYCLLCYLITPFLSHYFENSKHIVKRCLALSVIIIILMETFFNYFNPAWIFCYLIGFFLGCISKTENSKASEIIHYFIIIGAILSNTIQIIQDYILKLKLNGIIAALYWRFRDYAHVLLGVALFIIFKFAFSKLFNERYPDSVKKLCSYSDKYSYDVYLVHQFVILGPFSLMNLTSSLGFNLVLIITIILVCATVVNFLSNRVRKIIDASDNE